MDRGREQHRNEKEDCGSISEKIRDRVDRGGTMKDWSGVVRSLQMRRNPSYTREDQKGMTDFWWTEMIKGAKGGPSNNTLEWAVVRAF